MLKIKPSVLKNKTLTNIFNRQIELIQKKTSKLHEDLQYEYNLQIEDLKS
jgi:hypothetical protein